MVWMWIRQRFADLLNESKDPTALCAVRVGAYAALAVLLVKFALKHDFTADYMTSFGQAAAMIIATIVGKHFVENQ